MRCHQLHPHKSWNRCHICCIPDCGHWYLPPLPCRLIAVQDIWLKGFNKSLDDIIQDLLLMRGSGFLNRRNVAAGLCMAVRLRLHWTAEDDTEIQAEPSLREADVKVALKQKIKGTSAVDKGSEVKHHSNSGSSAITSPMGGHGDMRISALRGGNTGSGACASSTNTAL
jgi:hypothetical protein